VGAEAAGGTDPMPTLQLNPPARCWFGVHSWGIGPSASGSQDPGRAPRGGMAERSCRPDPRWDSSAPSPRLHSAASGVGRADKSTPRHGEGERAPGNGQGALRGGGMGVTPGGDHPGAGTLRPCSAVPWVWGCPPKHPKKPSVEPRGLASAKARRGDSPATTLP